MNLKKNELVDLFGELSEGYSSQFLKQILTPTGRGGVYAARDYISANAILAELSKVPTLDKSQINQRSDIKKFLHPTTMFRLSSYTPMLAFRYDELKESEKKAVFDDRDWCFSEKQNGARGWLIHSKGVTKLYSRNYSTRDCSLPEYWGNILQEVSDGDTFAVDVEIKFEPDAPLTDILADYGIVTDSRLEAMTALLQMNAPQALEIQKQYKERFGKDLVVFRCITPLYYNGVNYKKKTLREGFLVEKECIEALQKRGVNIKPIRKIIASREEKEAFLNQIIDIEHGEGVVAHHLPALYCTSEKRDRGGFVKIKRSVGAQAAKQGLGDTIDGWVSGYKLGTPGTDNEGLVSALEFTTTIRRADGTCYDHVIAWAPNIERTMKMKITKIVNGEPVLDENVYGLIGELTGQNISAKSKALTHPRLLRFPVFDKSKLDCIYSEAFIESQID